MIFSQKCQKIDRWQTKGDIFQTKIFQKHSSTRKKLIKVCVNKHLIEISWICIGVLPRPFFLQQLETKSQRYSLPNTFSCL